jgi:CubicO group peptidase (beta-lactamase class C family)
MRVVPNRASSYIYTRRGIENAVNDNVQIAFAAGALQATAQDFAQWYRTLLSGKLIKKATLQKAWSHARLSDGTLADYGYGWFIGELQGSPVVEHGGNMGGFMSHAIYLPKEDILVSVFFNFRERLPEILAADLAATAIGRPLNIKTVTLPDELLQAYTGTYKNTQNIDSIIGMENGTLFYQKAGGPKWKLIPYAKDKLFFDNTSTIGEIRRDKDRAIIAFAMQTTRGTSKNVVTRTPSPISSP